ncbi:hypothetical protein E2C01_080474 [Portunus trituberculatus]|uniref:Uncharacterized protein n=1 Tax=Portunus trituberculatus TaxID=210409 RepID=A0A5B7IMB5_PORTR|nr:hypothetical protein [Portunus trituberculatus]
MALPSLHLLLPSTTDAVLPSSLSSTPRSALNPQRQALSVIQSNYLRWSLGTDAAAMDNHVKQEARPRRLLARVAHNSHTFYSLPDDSYIPMPSRRRVMSDLPSVHGRRRESRMARRRESTAAPCIISGVLTVTSVRPVGLLPRRGRTRYL